MRIPHQRGPLYYVIGPLVWVVFKTYQLYKKLTDKDYDPAEWNGLPSPPPRSHRRTG